MPQRPTDADHLFWSASSYWLAVNKLSKQSPERLEPMRLAISHMLAMGFELALKAILIKLGANEKETISLGHRLLDTYEAAENRGFAFIDPELLRAGLTVIDQAHREHSYRYLPVVEELRVPQVDPTARLLDAVLAHARNMGIGGAI